MATVDGITAAKAQEIEEASVVSGEINISNGHLILTTVGGTDIDAGLVTDIAHLIDTSTHGVGLIVGATETQSLSNKTLITPTIASFANAQHQHDDGASGGVPIFEGVKAVRTAVQGVANANNELLSFTATSLYDIGLYKTSNTVFTIPSTGYYDILVQVPWEGNATGRRSVDIRLNDSSSDGSAGSSIGKANPSPGHSAGFTVNVAAQGELLHSDDTIKILVFQNSGGSLNIMGNTDIGRTCITITKHKAG